MNNVKKYILKRVGAGPGCAIFSCEQLLGSEVAVIDSADYAAIETECGGYKLALERIRRGAPDGVYAQFLATEALERHNPFALMDIDPKREGSIMCRYCRRQLQRCNCNGPNDAQMDTGLNAPDAINARQSGWKPSP
jgi:hypothetical protein